MEWGKRVGLVVLFAGALVVTFGGLALLNPAPAASDSPASPQPTDGGGIGPVPTIEESHSGGGTPEGARSSRSIYDAASSWYGAESIPSDWWNTSREYRESDLQFRNVSRSVGLSYRSAHTYRGAQEFVSNAGAYASDYDGDGWTDVLLVGGERPVLFHNDNGTFRPSGEIPPLNRTIQSAVFLDFDADGDDDLLLLANYDRPLLLENHGDGFERTDAGLPRFAMPYGGTVGDFNEDGCPDLFVIQYGDWRRTTPAAYPNYDVPPMRDNAGRNRLFEGDCGSFTETTSRAGIRGFGWSLATSSVDFDGDGDLDVYVANDYNHDVLYLNRGSGTFRRRVLGGDTNRNGMAAEVADVNGDARPDVFVTNIRFPEAVATEYAEDNDHLVGNTLMVNTGNGTFENRARSYGVWRGGHGWSAVLADLDNDGDDDLVHTNKAFSPGELNRNFLNPDAVFRTYRYPLVRERRGDRFVPVDPPDLGFTVTNGRGLAHLDFDRDGDADLLVADTGSNYVSSTGTSRGENYVLYENVGATGNAIQVALRAPDRPVLGATVTVTAGGTTQTGFYTARTDFLSQDTRTLHFGVGDARSVDVTVAWPDGTTTRYDDVATGQRVVLTPDGVVRRLPFTDG
ncbi:MAG: CRTAC1 family protein [Halorientalis sp.]